MPEAGSSEIRPLFTKGDHRSPRGWAASAPSRSPPQARVKALHGKIQPRSDFMRADLWPRVEEVYHDVAEAPPENRAALLDVSCCDDPELRREVEALLDARDRLGDFLAPEGLVRQIADLTPEP